MFGGQIREPLALPIVQDLQYIPGNPDEEHGVVSLPGGINIAHILKAEEIAHLAWRHEGGRAEITREERQPAEGDGAQLRAIRDRLRQGILAWLSVCARLRATVSVRRPVTRLTRGALVATAGLTRRRRQVA